MPQSIAGLDLGTKSCGLVFLDYDGKILGHHTILSSGKDINKRIYELAQGFSDISDFYAPEIVYVETPIFIQNFWTSLALGELLGACTLICQQKNIKVEKVSNKTWKKHICGNGSAAKKEIAICAQNRWPDVEFNSQDEKDASLICLFG